MHRTGRHRLSLRGTPPLLADKIRDPLLRNLLQGDLDGANFHHTLPRRFPGIGTKGDFLETPVSDCVYEVFGAGEGIRTLDPDLGKVVLYP